MARKKVKLAWIANSTIRRATFRKRRAGLFKKVGEIVTLCDIPACAIVYGPDKPQPEVWPSLPDARRMVQSFLELPEVDQNKKTTNQESFLQVRAKKMSNQYHRSERNIQDLELCMLLYDYMCGREMDELNQHDAASVFYYADMREKMINHLLHTAMAKEESSGSASNALSIEHPNFQYNNVFPNVVAATSNVADTAINVIPDVALTSRVATTTQASNTSLSAQMMFPWSFGVANANQWINPNPFGPFN